MCFNEKIFTKGEKMGLSLRTQLQKTIPRVEKLGLISKKKMGTVVSKVCHANSVLRHKRNYDCRLP